MRIAHSLFLLIRIFFMSCNQVEKLASESTLSLEEEKAESR